VVCVFFELLVAGAGFEPRSSSEQNHSPLPPPIHHRPRYEPHAPRTFAAPLWPNRSRSRNHPQ